MLTTGKGLIGSLGRTLAGVLRLSPVIPSSSDFVEDAEIVVVDHPIDIALVAGSAVLVTTSRSGQARSRIP
jgi:hypothetical protein